MGTALFEHKHYKSIQLWSIWATSHIFRQIGLLCLKIHIDYILSSNSQAANVWLILLYQYLVIVSLACIICTHATYEYVVFCLLFIFSERFLHLLFIRVNFERAYVMYVRMNIFLIFSLMIRSFFIFILSILVRLFIWVFFCQLLSNLESIYNFSCTCDQIIYDSYSIDMWIHKKSCISSSVLSIFLFGDAPREEQKRLKKR